MSGVAWKFECPKCKKKVVLHREPIYVFCSPCNKRIRGIETTTQDAERWINPKPKRRSRRVQNV